MFRLPEKRTPRIVVGAGCAAAAFAASIAFHVYAQDPAPATPPEASLGEASSSDPYSWPRTFNEGDVKFVVYQPQLEKWDNVHMIMRSAVSVETVASPQPSFGVIWMDAHAQIDRQDRVVTLDHIGVRGDFPTAPDKGATYVEAIKNHFPEVNSMDLDRLEASYAVLRAEIKAEHGPPLKNDPPRIVFSNGPTILALVDGKPVMRHAGKNVDRVINSRALILQDGKAGRFYLGVGDRFLEARTLDGPWTLAGIVSSDVDAARANAEADKSADLYQEDTELTNLVASNIVPRVIVATSPTELIETQGPPEMVPIEGTRLLWVKNSEADVFVDTTTNQNYVLISGRWFRAPALEGPWSYVPGHELPADFAKIPENQPAGEVLPSIPGTPQAQEAAIENNIPQTATVKRTDAKANIVYDGQPQLAAIDGTPLSYVINSSTPVILADGGYYACQDGVWFSSPGSAGPWNICDRVPASIYSIPTSSPLYYVTNCRVYDSNPDYVDFGYTPGYLGTCLSDDGCIVWGTGWWHRPWIGANWYGRPYTYGFGAGIRWNPGFGWSVGFGIGSRLPGSVWWGPLGFNHGEYYRGGWGGGGFHTNMINANIYGHWGGRSVIAHERAFARGGPVRANNYYAGSDGHIYRHEGGVWQHQEGAAWRANERRVDNDRRFENERLARERGNARAGNMRQREAVREGPAERGVERGGRQAQNSPGLRGGPVRGGGHAGGGHGGGGGGGHGGGHR